MNKGEYLSKGDLVCIVNPFGIIPDRFKNQIENSKRYLRQKGFSVHDFLSYKNHTDAIKKFNQSLDVKPKAIFPVGGNFGATEFLKDINYSKISDVKPIFVTYSSGTSLLLAINSKSNLVNFYGPHLTFLNTWSSFRENKFTESSFWNMVSKKDSSRGIGSKVRKYSYSKDKDSIKNIYEQCDFDSEIEFIKDDGVANGQIIAGTLQGIASLIGTEYLPDFKNKILFTDSFDVGYEEIITEFKKIKEDGVLNGLEGMIISNITSRPDSVGKKLPELSDKNKRQEFMLNIKKIFNENFPICYGYPLGHSKYKLTLPNGIHVKFNFSNGELEFLEDPLQKLF